jgi:hypothetical protein
MAKRKHHKKGAAQRPHINKEGAAAAPDKADQPVKPEVVAEATLEAVREAEAAGLVAKGKGGNLFIGTLNVIVNPLRELIDPVKKVCYEPFLERYEHKYKRKYPKHHSKVWLFDIALLVFAGLLAAVGLFAHFLLPLIPQPTIVYLEAVAPDRLVSGELTEFALSYRNDSDQPLADVEFRLELPSGFVPNEPDEVQFNGHPVVTETIGLVEPHQEGQIRVAGRLYGPVGSRQELNGLVSFWRAGDTQARRAATTRSWLVEESRFRVALRPEDEVVRGRQLAVTIPYANLDDRALNTRIRLQPPDDFVITGSQPGRISPNEWQLGQLEPNENGNITVYGYFRAGAAKPAVPSFLVQAWVEDQDEFRLIQELRQSVEALSGGFVLEQRLVQPSTATAVSLGDELRLELNYRNTGKQPIQAVKIELQADEAWLAGEPKLVWDATDEPALALLAPGATGSITANLKLVDELPELAPDKLARLSLQGVAEYQLGTAASRPLLAETASYDLAINTELGLKAVALYWTADGNQVGSGPLPPEPGRVTKYRVVVQVSSSTNRVDEATFEATLPTVASWTGRYSVNLGQPLAYLPAERRLVWHIGSLPPKHASPEAGASFEVGLNPDSRANPGILLQNLRLCGQDSGTGARVCTRVGELNIP